MQITKTVKMNIMRSFLLAMLIFQTNQEINGINNTDDNINNLEDTTTQRPTTKSLDEIRSTSEYPKTTTMSSTTTVTSNAWTRADCGSTVSVGSKQVMTCHVNGRISNGIRWFRGTEEIITCYKEHFCKTLNINLYQIYPEAHSVTKQAFIINDVSDADTKQTWSCVDGGVSLIGHTELSSCNMKKGYDIAITADCGLEVQLGKSHVLKCILPHYNSYTVTWFRDRESVLSCSSSSSCIIAPEHKSLYTFSVSTNRTSISLVIISVSEEDMEKSWSCVAGSTYPTYVQESATCNLEDEFLISVNCGQDVNVGKSHILTCTLPASITSDISWFRDQESIISCSGVSNCVVAAEKTQLYSIISTNDKHSLIISRVSQEDLDKSWSCIVGTRYPENVRESSTCTLHEGFGDWKITTIVLGSFLAVSLISLAVLAIKVSVNTVHTANINHGDATPEVRNATEDVEEYEDTEQVLMSESMGSTANTGQTSDIPTPRYNQPPAVPIRRYNQPPAVPSQGTQNDDAILGAANSTNVLIPEPNSQASVSAQNHCSVLMVETAQSDSYVNDLSDAMNGNQTIPKMFLSDSRQSNELPQVDSRNTDMNSITDQNHLCRQGDSNSMYSITNQSHYCRPLKNQNFYYVNDLPDEVSENSRMRITEPETGLDVIQNPTTEHLTGNQHICDAGASELDPVYAQTKGHINTCFDESGVELNVLDQDQRQEDEHITRTLSTTERYDDDLPTTGIEQVTQPDILYSYDSYTHLENSSPLTENKPGIQSTIHHDDSQPVDFEQEDVNGKCVSVYEIGPQTENASNFQNLKGNLSSMELNTGDISNVPIAMSELMIPVPVLYNMEEHCDDDNHNRVQLTMTDTGSETDTQKVILTRAPYQISGDGLDNKSYVCTQCFGFTQIPKTISQPDCVPRDVLFTNPNQFNVNNDTKTFGDDRVQESRKMSNSQCENNNDVPKSSADDKPWQQNNSRCTNHTTQGTCEVSSTSTSCKTEHTEPSDDGISTHEQQNVDFTFQIVESDITRVKSYKQVTIIE